MLTTHMHTPLPGNTRLHVTRVMERELKVVMAVGGGEGGGFGGRRAGQEVHVTGQKKGAGAGALVFTHLPVLAFATTSSSLKLRWSQGLVAINLDGEV